MVTIVGIAPPRPMPVNNRQIKKFVGLSAKQFDKTARLNKVVQNNTMRLRPNLSAAIVSVTAPIIIPINEADPKKPACCAESCQSFIKCGSKEP